MAITSINLGRVTGTLAADSLLSALRRNTAELFTQQSRISVGRNYLYPSDDPRNAAQALDLNQVLDQQGQIITNIRHASNTLDTTDLAMSDVSSLIIEAQQVASQMVGSTASTDEREAEAEVIASIREQLQAVGNRTIEGRYLFAGRDTNEKPFSSALGGIAYAGDVGDIFARVTSDDLEAINLPGNVLFGALSSEVTSARDLNPPIRETTRMEDLGGALSRGVRLGTFQIVEEGGATVNVDIANADTVADVVNAINQAAQEAGAGFTASLGSSGLVVTPGGAALTIRDISTGTTAQDLGLVTTAPSAGAITGSDLNVALTRTTAVADLNGGAGLDLTSGLILTNGGQSVTIDLSAAETVQDILNTINNAGLYVRAQINAAGDGIEVLNTVSGTDLTVGENGGTTATDLGIRSLHADTLVSSLNHGQGLRTVDSGADLRVTARDGSSFTVALAGVRTVADVLDAINTAATDAGVAVTADLALVGNGIRLTDQTGGAGSLSVARENYSFAVDDLGLLQSVADPAADLVGNDVNGVRVNGVLSDLCDLERALRDDDTAALSTASENLDVHLQDFNRSRGVIGARAKAMQDRLSQTEQAVTSTEALLGQVQDVDYTEAITKFQQAQLALQASLTTGAQIMNLSLLDFLS